MCGTAAALSSRSTVMRTISEPARCSAATWATVWSTSAVSVLVMDCTATGAPPPTITPPTSTATDRRRSWGCASIILSPRVRSARTAGALSTWPVHDDNPCKDERCCGRKRRCQRLAQDGVTCQDAEHGRQKCKYRQLARRIALNEREPGREGESHDPDALIK